MKKKRRLKRWVKEFLAMVVFALIIYTIAFIGLKSISKTAKQCDEYYGRTCSIYEIDQYGKGIRR